MGVDPDTTQTPLPGSSLGYLLCPTLGPGGGVKTGQYAWLGKREREESTGQRLLQRRGPVLQQPLGTSHILPERQGNRSDSGAIWK